MIVLGEFCIGSIGGGEGSEEGRGGIGGGGAESEDEGRFLDVFSFKVEVVGSAGIPHNEHL